MWALTACYFAYFSTDFQYIGIKKENCYYMYPSESKFYMVAFTIDIHVVSWCEIQITYVQKMYMMPYLIMIFKMMII